MCPWFSSPIELAVMLGRHVPHSQEGINQHWPHLVQTTIVLLPLNGHMGPTKDARRFNVGKKNPGYQQAVWSAGMQQTTVLDCLESILT